MSNEQQAQADKNTSDIRKIKVSVPIMWGIGILISCGTAIWGVATYTANKSNSEVNYKADLSRQSDDQKKYLLVVIQRFRTKDSTDIANNHTDMMNLLNTYQIVTTSEIRLLREQCRKSMPVAYGERFHYDNSGRRVVTATENK